MKRLDFARNFVLIVWMSNHHYLLRQMNKFYTLSFSFDCINFLRRNILMKFNEDFVENQESTANLFKRNDVKKGIRKTKQP